MRGAASIARLRRGARWWAEGAALAALVLGACGDEFQELEVRYFGLDVFVQRDSAVFKGTTVQVQARADCTLQTCAPPGVTYSSSDSQRASVNENGLVTGGPDTGAVWIRATFQQFSDSVPLRVVQRGSPRWRMTLTPEVTAAAPAIAVVDTLVSIFVVHGVGSGSGRLRRLTLRGPQVWEVDTCPGAAVAPSVRDIVVVTGPDCTRAHNLANGAGSWTLGLGARGAGAAQVRGNQWLVPHIVPPQVAGDSSALALSVVLSIGGGLIRRDTLVQSSQLDSLEFTPAVAANGDAIMAWSVGGAGQVVRIDTLGAVVGQTGLPAIPEGAASVGANGQILVGTRDDLVALDSLGAALWSANLPAGSRVSSPVLDNQGNIFVQTAVGLASYAPDDGAERWRVDSLGTGADTISHAPVVLLNDEIVAVCQGSLFLCWVDGATGEVIQVAPIGGMATATPAVADDGSVVVLLLDGAEPVLATFYGRNPPLTVGWATEGRTMTRSRSLRP